MTSLTTCHNCWTKGDCRTCPYKSNLEIETQNGEKMLTNDQMKQGRFEKLAKGKKLYNAITNHLNNDGTVLICTYTKATKYQQKHINMFKLGKSGSVYVQRGKNWDCIDFVGIKLIN